MNCPSRHDTEIELDDGYFQGPNVFSADLTTRHDVGRIADARTRSDHALKSSAAVTLQDLLPEESTPAETLPAGPHPRRRVGATLGRLGCRPSRWWPAVREFAVRFPRFVGPGFMIAVAYIDPGNYATDIAAGATFRFKLLCVILLSNLIAIFLQILCIKLGSVTGMNLSQMCRAHCPRWVNYGLYFFAEAAVIATDIAEVIGTAIALNLLLSVPLVAGCAISIVGVLFILVFYRPNGGPWAMRIFEFLVAFLVLGVAICFCIELSLITGVSVREVFRGYVPSKAVIEAQGLYQACGILGATVMPHSLFLGSALVQPRLREFDQDNGISAPGRDDKDPIKYRPSLAAIRACLTYSAIELTLCLFTFALFINSSILIVAGAALSDIADAADASLFGIYHLLRSTLGLGAAIVFGLALLLSGVTAMIICTIAGQIVCEGHLQIKLKPWVRALMTRSLSIIPAIIIAAAIGKSGLSTALVASQVTLSVILPFVSAPLIWFTSRAKYMTISRDRLAPSRDVHHDENSPAVDGTNGTEDQVLPDVVMKNNWFTTTVAILAWLLIAVMNIALLVLVGLGDA